VAGAEDPFSPLLADHARLLERLKTFEGILEEMVRSRRVSPEGRVSLDESLHALRDGLLPHFRLEEEVVLPPLEAAVGRFGTLVNVIAYEHDEVRREIEKLREARAALDASTDVGPAIEEFNRHGVFTIQFLWDHFRKERTSLFPTAVQRLSPSQLEAIRSRLGGR